VRNPGRRKHTVRICPDGFGNLSALTIEEDGHPRSSADSITRTDNHFRLHTAISTQWEMRVDRQVCGFQYLAIGEQSACATPIAGGCGVSNGNRPVCVREQDRISHIRAAATLATQRRHVYTQGSASAGIGQQQRERFIRPRELEHSFLIGPNRGHMHAARIQDSNHRRRKGSLDVGIASQLTNPSPRGSVSPLRSVFRRLIERAISALKDNRRGE
jgi:hypothetical protein